MRDHQGYQGLIKLIEASRSSFCDGRAAQETEKILVRVISDTWPTLGRHLHYAFLDKNSGRIDELIGVALDHVRTLHHTSQQPITKKLQPTSSISHPFNEILLSMLIQPKDA